MEVWQDDLWDKDGMCPENILWMAVAATLIEDFDFESEAFWRRVKAVRRQESEWPVGGEYKKCPGQIAIAMDSYARLRALEYLSRTEHFKEVCENGRIGWSYLRGHLLKKWQPVEDEMRKEFWIFFAQVRSKASINHEKYMKKNAKMKRKLKTILILT